MLYVGRPFDYTTTMFESMIAQATQVAQDNILTSIVSIVVSLGIILPIVGKYISKINPKLKIVSQYTDTFGQKTAEQSDELYMLVDALKVAAPEVEAYIKQKYGKDINYFRERVEIGAEQAGRFKGQLNEQDPKLLANSVTDLPRETKKTTPGSSLGAVDPVAGNTDTDTRPKIE